MRLRLGGETDGENLIAKAVFEAYGELVVVEREARTSAVAYDLIAGAVSGGGNEIGCVLAHRIGIGGLNVEIDLDV